MAIERIPLRDYDICREGADLWPPRPLLRGDAAKGRAAGAERFRRKDPGGGPLRNGRRRLFRLSRKVWRTVWGDQSGITGLETAIVLIAFIVVAAVFAFAVLTTGLFTTERAKQTAKAGLAEAQSTLSTKGSVIALANTGRTSVTSIKFKISNAAGADPITLTGAVLTYTDSDQSITTTQTGASVAADANNPVVWSPTWLTGGSPVIDPTEVVEIEVRLVATATVLGVTSTVVLGTSTRFDIELAPVHGAVLRVSRSTPSELKDVMNLE